MMLQMNLSYIRRKVKQMRPNGNTSIKARTNGKPAIFIIEWDSYLINRVADWIEVPEAAMPAIKFIIGEVEKQGGVNG